jgi:hypothetical protein
VITMADLTDQNPLRKEEQKSKRRLDDGDAIREAYYHGSGYELDRCTQTGRAMTSRMIPANRVHKNNPSVPNLETIPNRRHGKTGIVKLHVRYQRLTVRRMTRSSNDKPMAAMLFARTARPLATHGNSRMSKSGASLSGQNNPANPNVSPNWTKKHTAKLFMVRISNGRVPFSLERSRGVGGKLRRCLPDNRQARSCKGTPCHLTCKSRTADKSLHRETRRLG